MNMKRVVAMMVLVLFLAFAAIPPAPAEAWLDTMAAAVAALVLPAAAAVVISFFAKPPAEKKAAEEKGKAAKPTPVMPEPSQIIEE